MTKNTCRPEPKKIKASTESLQCSQTSACQSSMNCSRVTPLAPPDILALPPPAAAPPAVAPAEDIDLASGSHLLKRCSGRAGKI